MEKDNILKSLKTITEYFILRKTLQNDDSMMIFSVEGLPEKYAKQKGILPFVAKTNISNKTVEVLWIPCFGIRLFKHLSALIEMNKLIIIIYKTRSPESEKHTNLFNNANKKSRIELFSIAELQYNIFNNFLSTKIRILREKEKEEIIAFYGKESLFPKILVSDKICRYLGAEKSDILTFQREEDGREYTTLRIVS